MNRVIAISGYPGSGKTTVSKNILKMKSDLVYFDFGYFFRPLTYFLVNELKLDENEIRTVVKNDELRRIIDWSYLIVNNKVKVGINGNFYNDILLNSLQMNMDTVMVGSIIGDKLNDELRLIIDDIKEKHNILLNARRPIMVYPNVDYHIFLEADFSERLNRKMKMNLEDYDTTFNKLVLRDQREQESGFWEKYDFTEVIDTTRLSEKEVLEKVLNIINDNYLCSINNLTLILGSYKCDKHCPYCIAKNNQKFSSEDKLENLDNVLEMLQSEKIKSKRFVISGNGEPSLYSIEKLCMIKEKIVKYKELFDIVRIHSSGNIFYSENKFEIFNTLDIPVEFEVLRVALNSEVDMKVLGYDKDYLTSPLFKRGKIKCDIALTDHLERTNIVDQFHDFLNNNPSIKEIRLKKLLVGDHDFTPQAKWVREHSLSEEEIEKIIRSLELVLKNKIYFSKNKMIIYKSSGDYDNDYVINNGEIQNYNNDKTNIKVLKRKLKHKI